MSQESINQLKAEISALTNETQQATANVVANSDPIANGAYDDSLMLSYVVVGLGVFVLLCITYLIQKNKQPDILLRPFGTILIVIGAVFLIVAGYSEKQIAPVIGLLGTIAGYILGKESKEKSETDSEPNPDKPGGNSGGIG
ncbi:hypothetical protein [Pseudomonas lini]